MPTPKPSLSFTSHYELQLNCHVAKQLMRMFRCSVVARLHAKRTGMQLIKIQGTDALWLYDCHSTRLLITVKSLMNYHHGSQFYVKNKCFRLIHIMFHFTVDVTYNKSLHHVPVTPWLNDWIMLFFLQTVFKIIVRYKKTHAM